MRGHTYASFIEARKNGEFGDYDIMQDPFMRKYTQNFIQN